MRVERRRERCCCEPLPVLEASPLSFVNDVWEASSVGGSGEDDKGAAVAGGSEAVVTVFTVSGEAAATVLTVSGEAVVTVFTVSGEAAATVFTVSGEAKATAAAVGGEGDALETSTTTGGEAEVAFDVVEMVSRVEDTLVEAIVSTEGFIEFCEGVPVVDAREGVALVAAGDEQRGTDFSTAWGGEEAVASSEDVDFSTGCFEAGESSVRSILIALVDESDCNLKQMTAQAPSGHNRHSSSTKIQTKEIPK